MSAARDIGANRDTDIQFGSGDCTVNLINHGIVVREDMASIEFAGNGDASSHTCQIDRQQRRQCKSANSWL